MQELKEEQGKVAEIEAKKLRKNLKIQNEQI
jgi:hypothetical protein